MENIDSVLPSEMGRLIYGYLSNNCDQNLADEFYRSSPLMMECKQMKQNTSGCFHPAVQDVSLETILHQYSKLCTLIFKCSSENERQHLNILNLLAKILSEWQQEPAIINGNFNLQVLKNVQNLPLKRKYADVFDINLSKGSENKFPAGVAPANNLLVKCKKNKQFASAKKKLTTLTSIEPSHTSCVSGLQMNSELKKTFIGVNDYQSSDSSAVHNYAQSEVSNSNIHSKEILNAPNISSAFMQSHIGSSVRICEFTKDAETLSELIPEVTNVPFANVINDRDQLNCLNEINISYFPLTGTSEDVDMKSDYDLLPITTLSKSPNSSEKDKSENFKKREILMKKSDLLSSSQKPIEFDKNCRHRSKTGSLISCNIPSSSSSSNDVTSPKTLFSFSEASNKLRDDDLNPKKNEMNANCVEEADEISASKTPNLISAVADECLNPNFSSEFIADLSKLTPVKECERKTILSQSCLNQETHEIVSRRNDSKLTESPRCRANEPVLSEECLNIFEHLSKGFKYRSPHLTPAKSKGVFQASLSPFSKMYVTPTKLDILPNSKIFPTVMNSVASDNSVSVENVKSKKSYSNFDLSVIKSPFGKSTEKKRNLTRSLTSNNEKLLSRCLLSNGTANKNVMKKCIESVNGTRKSTNSRTKDIQISESQKDPYWKIAPAVKLIPTTSRNSRTHRRNLLLVYVPNTNEVAELDVSREILIYHRNSTCTEKS